MISGVIGWATFIASIIWAVKGEMIYALGFLIATGIFWCSWNLTNVATRLHKFDKMYAEKITAEKTLSAIMTAVKNQEVDDGK